MRSLLRVVPLGAIVVLVAGVALAQPPFRGGGFGRGNIGMLLRQESVQKELKLTEEQARKVEDLGEAMREKFQEAFALEGEERDKKMQELREENEKAIAKILKPEQMKRLKQISYQQQGPSAFTDAEVAKALQLTDAQKKDIQKINADTFAQMRELVQPGSPPDEETRKKMTELRTAAAEKIVKLLNSDQKTKWKELQGEPFKGEIRFGPPR